MSFDEVADFVEGLEAELVGAEGRFSAEGFYEVAEGGVEFVLEESGAGGGAAVAEWAAVDEDGFDAGVDEVMGDECAGDATADDGDGAMEVMVEWGKDEGGGVEAHPESGVGFEVHRGPCRGDRRRQSAVGTG